jgi:hypothetical protein
MCKPVSQETALLPPKRTLCSESLQRLCVATKALEAMLEPQGLHELLDIGATAGERIPCGETMVVRLTEQVLRGFAARRSRVYVLTGQSNEICPPGSGAQRFALRLVSAAPSRVPNYQSPFAPSLPGLLVFVAGGV